MSQKKIIFLVSGNGGTLKFLYQALSKIHLNEELVIYKVLADRECGAIEFARKVGLQNLVVNYSQLNRIDFYNEIALDKADIIITNIHKILDNKIVAIPGIQFINLHYSLLPSFGGLIGMKTIFEAKKRNVRFIGATTHIVSKKVDQGPVICQSIFPVNWEASSMKEIQQNVFQSGCLCLLNSIKSGRQKLYFKSKDVLFNPGLSFNPVLFDEQFWERIKNY